MRDRREWRGRENRKKKGRKYICILICTLILNKTTTFRGKEDIIIEFIVILPLFSGNVSGKPEVDSGGKPEQKEST